MGAATRGLSVAGRHAIQDLARDFARDICGPGAAERDKIYRGNAVDLLKLGGN